MKDYEIVRGFIESPRFHKRWFELGFSLLNLFVKEEKENLTKAERNQIKKAMKQLEKDLFGGE